MKRVGESVEILSPMRFHIASNKKRRRIDSSEM